MAMCTGRPRPISRPVLAPPPPANRSTFISSSISNKGRPYCPWNAKGGIFIDVIVIPQNGGDVWTEQVSWIPENPQEDRLEEGCHSEPKCRCAYPSTHGGPCADSSAEVLRVNRTT